MEKFLWICLGGAVGTGARYLISGRVIAVFGGSLPYGTLAVNLIGSFFMGAVARTGPVPGWISPDARFILMSGVLGGFTTYSAFNGETLRFFHDGEIAKAFLNVTLMLVLCLVAGCAGAFVAERWMGR